MRIVASLEEFPDWMMQARTIPLPKVANFPGVCGSRPITIMATICRLWAKVTTAALLKHPALNLPASVTGLLPRRVSFEAAYDMQVLLEKYMKVSALANGVTLDLRKCFIISFAVQELKPSFLKWGFLRCLFTNGLLPSKSLLDIGKLMALQAAL